MEQGTAKESTKLQELAYELRVEQAMTREVITISPDAAMSEFMEVLRANRISGAPVIEEGQMIGIVSIEDLIKALAAGELDATVRDKMTLDPETICDDEPLVHAVSKFSKLRFGRFPVVDREGGLVGIITQGDIARAMLRRLEVDYREEEIHRYRASHIFEDLIADEVVLVFKYSVAGRDLGRAGEAASELRRTLSRLGVDPRVIRRVAVAAFEAEINMAVFTDGGELIAKVQPDSITLEALDVGPGIPDIERAMEPGYSTAPPWVQEMGFGAGMGLPNIRACADEMVLESTVEEGTRLEVVIYLGDERTDHHVFEEFHMTLNVLEKGAVGPLVAALMADYRVVGPQAKGSKFIFEPLDGPDDLRLDYGISIIPPSKVVLQPAQERLATFQLGEDVSVEAVVEPVPTVLLGVRTCDLKAIHLLDAVFSQDYQDAHYLAQREQTVVISLECLHPCDEHSFCKDMGTLAANDGYDLHLTDIGEAYAVRAGTVKGNALLEKYGQARPAGDAERARLDEAIGAKWPRFKRRLSFEAAELPSMLATAYAHPLWPELGDRCFSCGSCTNVCPTCYCFNVVDDVDLGLTEGERLRGWDSCQLDEFARVAAGENFREARAARQRHRFMRKGKYIHEKIGELGCVGCGRCIRTCVTHISIVEGFNAIHETAAGGVS